MCTHKGKEKETDKGRKRGARQFLHKFPIFSVYLLAHQLRELRRRTRKKNMFQRERQRKRDSERKPPFKQN